MAKVDENVITDLADVASESDREVLEELTRLSRHLVRARGVESVAKSQREDVWATIQKTCGELNADLSFLLDGVKLSWKRGGRVRQDIPDELKIAEVAPKLVARRAKLQEELAAVDAELAILGEKHTMEAWVEKKPSLTVSEPKVKVKAKK